jgi:hypothetical protein
LLPGGFSLLVGRTQVLILSGGAANLFGSEQITIERPAHGASPKDETNTGPWFMGASPSVLDSFSVGAGAQPNSRQSGQTSGVSGTVLEIGAIDFAVAFMIYLVVIVVRHERRIADENARNSSATAPNNGSSAENSAVRACTATASAGIARSGLR